MKVAFITPELHPLVRRTQLADVAGALTRALHDSGVNVHIFLPYGERAAADELTDLKESCTVEVQDGRDTRKVRVWTGHFDGLIVHLFDEPELFTGRHPYGDEDGPYPDNWRRYAIFSRAVLESFPKLKFTPDILHCTDWTAGLIPLLRKLEFEGREPVHAAAKAGTYMHVQNLAMQGAFEREVLPLIGLSHELFVHVGGIEQAGKVNFLKAGIEFSTIVGLSSPSMAEHVVELDRGFGLEESFERRDQEKEVIGITNGIDYAAWDPATDPLLPHTYSSEDPELNGKRRCKAALQSSLTLDNGPRTLVVAVLGRFDADSGFDVLGDALTAILERNVEVVMMGAGQPEIVERIRTMENSFAGRLRFIEGYDSATAHAILGGSDVLLMPSHTHPSNALCAITLRYGTVPLLYAKSGLEDTVVYLGQDPKNGTGFSFDAYTGQGLLDAIDEVRTAYKEAGTWKELVHRCLKQDFSWKATAEEYKKAYRRVTRRTRGKVAKRRNAEA